MLIDTHSHLFDEAFETDRPETIRRAKEAGIGRILSPAIDSSSHEALFALCRTWPGYCLPMMGLHPTSVNDLPNWRDELELVKRYLSDPPAGAFCAVGEVGLDLYWDKNHLREQTEALEKQIEWSLEYDLPLAIHTRDAWPEMVALLEKYRGTSIRGVMHAFAESEETYLRVKECGDFLFGIGGTVTFKKSILAETLPRMSLDDLVLETDSPYLTPAPYRGKRNESSYLTFIRDRVAALMARTPEEVERCTTENARRMFGC